jgi:hypothetical protein
MARAPPGATLGSMTRSEKGVAMRKIFEYGGVIASVMLIAFGIGAIVVGLTGRDEVRTTLAREHIVGSPDMTKTAIAAEVKEAGLTGVELPTCDVAGKTIDTGSEAKCFASYMRIHALEATSGQTYAEMGRFLDKNGKATSDEALAAKDPKTGKPVENGLRNLWVTETALATALNTSFFAERVALFSLLMGIGLLLTGIGFLVLTAGGALRLGAARSGSPKQVSTAVN